MHEQALARTILREVAAICRERRLGRLRCLTLELGEFSGVEAPLLRSAIEQTCAEELGAPIELVIHIAPLEAECATCQLRFHVQCFQFRCPECGQLQVDIIRGEEVRLVNLIAELMETGP